MKKGLVFGSLLFLYGALTASAQYKSVNPQVSKIVSEVSEERIAAILKKLEGFGTRNIFSSQDDPARGVGAGAEVDLRAIPQLQPAAGSQL